MNDKLIKAINVGGRIVLIPLKNLDKIEFFGLNGSGYSKILLYKDSTIIICKELNMKETIAYNKFIDSLSCDNIVIDLDYIYEGDVEECY